MEGKIYHCMEIIHDCDGNEVSKTCMSGKHPLFHALHVLFSKQVLESRNTLNVQMVNAETFVMSMCQIELLIL